MSYTPLDDTLIVSGSPLAAVVARAATRNAAWLYDHRLHAWSCYWPAGAYAGLDPTVAQQRDWDLLAGMVYTKAHGKDDLDYSGLYVSSCPGEPIAAPLPVTLSGRANRVRVTMTVRYEPGRAGPGGKVWLWAQLCVGGATFPRAFDADADLVRTTPGVPQMASCVYPNAVALTGNGPDGWTTVQIDVDLRDNGRDWSPVNTASSGVPQLLLCVMSEPASVAIADAVGALDNYGVTHAVAPGGVQVQAADAAMPPLLRRGPKPHMLLRAALLTDDRVRDAARVSLHHVLCVRRYSQNETEAAMFVWPPIQCRQNGEGPVDAGVLRVYDVPAVRILSVRIEETQQP